MPAKKKRKSLDEIREDLAKRGVTEQDVADAVAWARKTPETGGIWEWLRSSGLVGANLKLKRPRVKPRKIDL